jgi:two-component system, LytTR family, sensor kinase
MMTAPSFEQRASQARVSRLNWVAWAAIIGLQATLFFLYRYLGSRIGNPQARVLPPLINEFTGVITGWIAFLLVLLPVMRRRPWRWDRWAQSLSVYAALLIAFSPVHTTLIWATRSALYPLAGLGEYGYGRMPLPYLMELPIDAVSFVLCAIVYNLLRNQREARERVLRAAELERYLTESQLRALRANLQPHFLFNALNTIASRVHDDPAQADRMITHLAELLRATLREGQVQQVSLARELELLHPYAELLRARFGDRCVLRRHVQPATLEAKVPALILQPLVENAVRHGNLSRVGSGAIDVMSVRSGEHLEITVSDDGPGSSADPWTTEGFGLKSTAERLRLLYGSAHEIRAENANGGFRVTVLVPFELIGGG